MINGTLLRFVLLLALTPALAACAAKHEPLPTAEIVTPEEGPGPNYIIGPGDGLSIFVWRNPELTTGVTVRPDGRVTAPLLEDLPATGRTPTQLARDIEERLKVYIQDPIVTVMVSGFVGPFAQQVRIIGEATRPQAIPYRANMTLLDVMISVGGLTEFAAGNRATIARFEEGKQEQFQVRLDDLVKDGDITANVKILPGDVLIVPESWF